MSRSVVAYCQESSTFSSKRSELQSTCQRGSHLDRFRMRDSESCRGGVIFFATANEWNCGLQKASDFSSGLSPQMSRKGGRMSSAPVHPSGSSYRRGSHVVAERIHVATGRILGCRRVTIRPQECIIRPTDFRAPCYALLSWSFGNFSKSPGERWGERVPCKASRLWTAVAKAAAFLRAETG